MPILKIYPSVIFMFILYILASGEPQAPSVKEQLTFSPVAETVQEFSHKTNNSPVTNIAKVATWLLIETDPYGSLLLLSLFLYGASGLINGTCPAQSA